MRPALVGVALACAALLAGCSTAAPGLTPTPTTTGSPTPTPPPTALPTALPTASPTLPQGKPSVGCVDGWSSPARDVPLYAEGLDILEGQMAVDGEWQVDEMRYFTGPDAPWIIEPHYEVVERWYVKAALADEPGFRGRWLLEKRTELIKGVSAVASYDSTGYASPDWYGYVGDGPPTEYPGLPGVWFGIPYDFVTGAGDHGQPGLPTEVIDCLAGT